MEAIIYIRIEGYIRGTWLEISKCFELNVRM